MRVAAAILSLAALLPAGEMQGAKIKFPGYDEKTGKLLWEFRADKVSQLSDDRFAAEGVELLFFGDHPCTCNSRTGSVDRATRTYRVDGEVKLDLTKDDASVWTEDLSWNAAKQTATSKSVSWLTGKGFKACSQGMEYDASKRQVHLLGKVQSLFAKELRGSLLPGEKSSSNETEAKHEPPTAEERAAGKLRQAAEGEVVIACAKGAVLDQNAQTLTYHGDVEVRSDQSVVRADRLIVTFTGQGDQRKVDTLRGEGNVAFSAPGEEGRGDSLVWSAEKQEAVLEGKKGRPVVLKRGSELLSGRTVVRSYTADTLVCKGRAHVITNMARSAQP